MLNEKMTLQRFQRRFSTERACMNHLFKLRWPDGYRCPRCGHSRYSFHSARKLYQCSECKYQASVTAGTIFHKTRTSLVHWFWIIFIMTGQKSGVSMLSLQGMLGIKSYRTIWTISHKIRKAMADRDSQYQLTGLVETLQTFLGPTTFTSKQDKAKGRPGFVVTIEDRGDSPGFAKIRRVASGSDLQTDIPVRGTSDSPVDAGEGLRDTPDEQAGGSYEGLNPLLISDRKPTRIGWARILMANLTGNIRGVHHGVSAKHLHRYLAEFLYRFNRRAWGSQILNRALIACVSVSTTTYEELKL